jgi:hypothetical protein
MSSNILSAEVPTLDSGYSSVPAMSDKPVDDEDHARQVGGRSVAWLSRINDRDPASCSTEHQGGAQAGGPASHHRHVISLGVH